jgi:hypothetical protein
VPLHWNQPGVAGAVITVRLLAALYGMLGAGLGLLLRNTAAALGLALLWAFVVEGILPALIHAPAMVRWLPEATANAVLHGASASATTLPAAAALAVLTGYAVVLATGGAIVTTRQRSAPPPDDQPTRSDPAARQATSWAARTRPRPAPYAKPCCATFRAKTSSTSKASPGFRCCRRD